ncbi:exonuclease domain-containing protein [Phenylobacterium sp. LH3H17]|uniref:exonuclease domain-containing protein n=1 Tax=Phenylobacterium sp. LH3H17 TaxID=2903901 RepID=UPI0020C9F09F|nr:exonuclease domain-containing protein [Phenylobacterium sp. LH3H17]UTP38030.1 exonuclease domain-containing protein [Phenylobacterium sp. LH3H17]
MAVTILQDLARQCGLKPASELDPRVEPRTSPLPYSAPIPAPDFVVIDVETACHRASSICQIGIVGFSGGREVFAYETLVDPQDAFSPFNIRLHGIGPERVAGQPNFPLLYGTLLEHLGGRVTVAHSNFDHGALSAACRIAGLPMIRSRWLDSVKVARHAWPDLPTHRLNALAGHLELEHKHHDALSDARVAGWVVIRAMEKTGLDIAGYLAAPWRGEAPRRRRPTPAAKGPLAGERVAIIASPHNIELPTEIAIAGGRIMASVGRTTTMLVVAGTRPFSPGVRTTASFLQAEAFAAEGGSITILTAEELRDRIAAAASA